MSCLAHYHDGLARGWVGLLAVAGVLAATTVAVGWWLHAALGVLA